MGEQAIHPNHFQFLSLCCHTNPGKPFRAYYKRGGPHVVEMYQLLMVLLFTLIMACPTMAADPVRIGASFFP
jgi:hypothetical protein